MATCICQKYFLAPKIHNEKQQNTKHRTNVSVETVYLNNYVHFVLIMVSEVYQKECSCYKWERMKEYVMDWTCSQNGETKNTCRISEEEPHGIQPFGRVRMNVSVSIHQNLLLHLLLPVLWRSCYTLLSILMVQYFFKQGIGKEVHVMIIYGGV